MHKMKLFATQKKGKQKKTLKTPWKKHLCLFLHQTQIVAFFLAKLPELLINSWIYGGVFEN
jgi:hypothetical protein